MAALVYDEAVNPALHRFLSFLRLLMFVHPRVGADDYARYVGLRTGLVPGWNAVYQAAGGEVPVKYIYIPALGSQEGGLNTEEHPGVPDDQIHVTQEEDLPSFEGSPAWRQVMQLAEVVSEQRPQGITVAWVQERMDLLHTLARTPLRGGDKGVDDRISQILARIRNAVNGPDGSLRTFTGPVAEVVDDFLSFRLTKRQASNILAVLLTYYAIKFPCPIDETGGVNPVQRQIDHLISLVSTITRDRHRYDLGSYAQLTYLGLLWADTALLMAKNLARRSQGDNLSHWFERRALYVDECAAHDLAPSLTHPISLAPFGLIEYLRARNVGIISAKGLYAGAGEIGDRPLDPEELWARVQAYSSCCNRLETGYDACAEVLSPALAEHLFFFGLTMKLGESLG